MKQVSIVAQPEKRSHAENNKVADIQVILRNETNPGNDYPDSEAKPACWSTIKKESGESCIIVYYERLGAADQF
jgi:hypothetical protein